MKKQNGSALLLVILITSALGILVFTSWHKSSLLFDLIVQREKYYKNFYLTEAVLNHGIREVRKQFNDYKKQQVVNLNFLVQNELHSPEKGAQLIVSPTVRPERNTFRVESNHRCERSDTAFDRLLIIATLYDNKSNKSLCSLSCVLVKNENKFFVQNFTCGATGPSKL